jgi:hypothetical protein
MFQQTAWITNHMREGSIPILNAFNVRGDAVYEELEPAKAIGLNIAADPSVGARGIDVLEISMDAGLFEKLKTTGDIVTHMQSDALGTPLLAISQSGCQAINANSLVETHRFWIPGKEPTEQEMATTRIPARHLN